MVSGIGGYGNCIGIPTVAGETKFDETYNENILVNAMAVGHTFKDKIFYSKARGVNKSVVYVGLKLVAMEFTGHQWHLLNLMKTQKKKTNCASRRPVY